MTDCKSMKVCVITCVSGTDPDRLCFVTVTTKDRKTAVLNLLQQRLEELDERDDDDELVHQDKKQFRKLYKKYKSGKCSIQQHDDECEPTCGAQHVQACDLIAIERSSPAEFHFYIEERVWNLDEDLDLTVFDY